MNHPQLTGIESLMQLDPVWAIDPREIAPLGRIWSEGMSAAVRLYGQPDLNQLTDAQVRAVIAACGEATPGKMVARHSSGESRVVEGAVAVLPIHGEIFHRPNWLTRWGFGVSSEDWGRMFDSVAANDDIAAIVLDVDSPGGMHAGTQDMAERVFQARSADRPIIAVVNDTMASAAYWVGSGADEIVASHGSITGSIGVIMMHVEISGALKQEGVTVTFIQSVPFKKEANRFEPLSPEAEAHLQSITDEAHSDFIGAVARNRGVVSKDPDKQFGEGRFFGEVAAKKKGLVDRIGTLDDVLMSLGVANPGRRVPFEAKAEAGTLDLSRTDADGMVLDSNGERALCGGLPLKVVESLKDDPKQAPVGAGRRAARNRMAALGR